MLVLLCYIFQAFLLGFVYAAGAGLNFRGANLEQYAAYDAWDFSINGTLSFLFQTHKRDAFLLYHDNKRNDRGQDWMEVFLYKGGVRLRMNIGFCSQHTELVVLGDFSNSKWHYVRITLGYKLISMSVDNTYKSQVVACRFKDKSRRRWAVMYLGGIPLFDNSSITSENWSSPTIWTDAGENMFEGCIGNLMYQKGNSRAYKTKLKRKNYTLDKCDNACLGDPQSAPKCRNGGICIDHIVTFDCDCKGTGYEGHYCSTESSMVYINGKGYIVYQISTPSIDWSMKNNYVSFRMVPLYHSGVILYLGKPSDHLVVELVKGKLQVAINLGGGQQIMRSNVTLNVSQYHFVEIRRRKQRLTVDINRGWEILTNTTKGNLYSLDLKGKERVAYFGGGPSPNTLPLSTSKRNFSGFLQQFIFDKFRVLDKVMPDMPLDKRFNIHGSIEEGNAKRDLLPSIDKIVGSGCGEIDDDEDMDRCPPPTTRCFSPDCMIFGTTEADITNEPSVATLPVSVQRGTPTDGVVMSFRESRGHNHSVSPWIIIIIVTAAVVAVVITIFFLYRWNNRYSGSFKPSKGEPGEGVQPAERGFEQPAFYVSPNKPTKAEGSVAYVEEKHADR